MTFKCWNFDIVTGLSAIGLLLYSLLAKKPLPKTLILTWNIVGLVLLVVIVMIAILSLPLPLQQLAFDQPNIAVLQFPYIYLPALLVPLVLLSHILALKVARSARGNLFDKT